MKQPSMILILPSVLCAISVAYAQSCFSPCGTFASCLPVLGQCRTDYTNAINDLSTCQAQVATCQSQVATCQSQVATTAHENYCRCCTMVELHNCCNHGGANGCATDGLFQKCYVHVWDNVFDRCINDPNERCPSRDAEGRCAGKEAFTANRLRGLLSQH